MVTVIPIIFGTLGIVLKNLEKRLNELEIRRKLKPSKLKPSTTKIGKGSWKKPGEIYCHSDSSGNPSVRANEKTSKVVEYLPLDLFGLNIHQFVIMVVNYIFKYLKVKVLLAYLLRIIIRIKRWGGLLWHINHCRLFNAKSSLYIYIKYIYGLVALGFMAYQPL